MSEAPLPLPLADPPLRYPPLVVLGLTGGIASGKSTVAEMFAELGATVLDADRLAREVVRPGEPALAELAMGRVNKPEDVVQVGDSVQVKIVELRAEERRLTLSIRQAQEAGYFGDEEETPADVESYEEDDEE